MIGNLKRLFLWHSRLTIHGEHPLTAGAFIAACGLMVSAEHLPARPTILIAVGLCYFVALLGALRDALRTS